MAVEKGIWNAGEFVQTVEDGHSIEFDGIGNSAAAWLDQPNPHFGNFSVAPWDVNSDGTVNILDLVTVAGQFGQSGNDLDGDVNGDGMVNILDLVIIAGHFGETIPAAPELR